MVASRRVETALREYLDRSQERQLTELVELLRIPSVSSSSEHKGAMGDCAAWLVEHLGRIGFENGCLIPTAGNPLVYADWLHAEVAPTLLVYGHYDVQATAPDELWDSSPFEPTVRDGRLYARGATDNKGQIFAALAALEGLLAVNGRLPCNVRILIEGEEELTAENLTAFLEANAEADFLAADLALVTDGGMLAEDIPGVATALRGMAALELTVRTASHDLHSGIYGGAVANAMQALAALLTSLKDPATGHVLVDGFYDDVRPIPESDRLAWERLPFDARALEAELGVSSLHGEPGFTTYERMWGRPTLDVCGAWGGFTGEGLKTVIPAEAHATISCRLVRDQDPETVLELIQRHIETHTPPGATVTIEWELPGCWPIGLPADHPAVRAALDALAEGFGGEPTVFAAGFSVPVVELLKRFLGLDSVLFGFTLPDENLHAPNEFIRLDVFERGVRTYAEFFLRQ
jgi:acetylornithine deacetylase/succinyl-diaminopimelate desuccinylase-like protein